MFIYRIYNLSDECYIGSTNDLKKRWNNHKCHYKRWKTGKANNCASFELFDKYCIENCFYELLETVQDESELKFRERYWIEFYGDNTVNKLRPVITKEEILKYYKEYHKNNREKILKQQKVKYTCKCGSTIRKADKSHHERSTKHQSFLQTKK